MAYYFVTILMFSVLLTVQSVSAKSGDTMLNRLDEYFQKLKGEIEEKYETRLKAMEAKFENQLTSLRREFQQKEVEYRQLIEGLEEARLNYEQDPTIDSQRDGLTVHGGSEEEEELLQSIGINEGHSNDSGQSRRTNAIQVDVSKRQFAEGQETKVAFFASVTNNLEHLGANQDIVFDHVVTNIGSAYSGNHGTFIAPVSGIYVFSTTLHVSGAETWCHFMVNGVIVAKIHLHGAQSSQTVVVHLNKGDDVSIQNTSLDKGLHGDMYSTFGGFLLSQDSSLDSSAIVG